MTCQGVVTDELEATLPLSLLARHREPQTLTTVMDTGFNGYLTLPRAVIEQLDLVFHSYAEAELGDGQAVVLRKFEGQVLWDDRPRPVTILETEGAPLVGMAFLRDHRVTIEVVGRGTVSVEAMEVGV